MTRVVEAIYVDGVLQPVEHLELPERQRVRLIVQTIDGTAATDRETAFAQFLSGVQSMNFRSTGPLPSRDELHDRA